MKTYIDTYIQRTFQFLLPNPSFLLSALNDTEILFRIAGAGSLENSGSSFIVYTSCVEKQPPPQNKGYFIIFHPFFSQKRFCKYKTELMSPAAFLIICLAMELLYHCSAQMKISAATCLCFVKHTLSKEAPQYPGLDNARHSYVHLPCGRCCSPFQGRKVQSHDLVNLTLVTLAQSLMTESWPIATTNHCA